nr:hypothetical protein Iba_chr02bCG8790 [Ipomoea batatas]
MQRERKVRGEHVLGDSLPCLGSGSAVITHDSGELLEKIDGDSGVHSESFDAFERLLEIRQGDKDREIPTPQLLKLLSNKVLMTLKMRPVLKMKVLMMSHLKLSVKKSSTGNESSSHDSSSEESSDEEEDAPSKTPK